MDILNSNILDKIVFGKVRIEKRENGYAFSRFTAEQENIWKEKNSYFQEEFFDGYFYRNCATNANIMFDFITDSKTITIDIPKLELVNEPTYFTPVEIFVNKKRVLEIKEIGEYSIRLNRKSRVMILLPHFSCTEISKIEVDDNSSIEPISKKIKWLFHGDSITHGCIPKLSSNSYVSRIIRKYDIDAINQGNSGYVNDERIITKIDGFEPDIVTSAYGINDFYRKNEEQYERDLYNHCKKIRKDFPKSKIYIISPVWCANLYEDESQFSKRDKMYDMFQKVTAELDLNLINGRKLIPNNRKYYNDDGVHPNDLGFGYYATRLMKLIKISMQNNTDTDKTVCVEVEGVDVRIE